MIDVGGPEAQVTSVRGESFVVSSSSGDVEDAGNEQGFYVRDTRFVARMVVEVDGARVLPLSGGVVGPGTAVFHGFVRPAVSRAVDPQVLVTRRRVVDDGLHEEVVIHNHGREAASFEVVVRCATDFAYIFDVKHNRVLPLVEATGGASAPAGPHLVLAGPDGVHRLEVTADPPGQRVDDGLCWHIDLAPGESRRLCLDLTAADEYGVARPRQRCEAFEGPPAPDTDRDGASGPAPAFAFDDGRLTRLVYRSLDDLQSLTVVDPDEPRDRFLAAGSPWFLTLFGRDSIWSAFMALPVDLDLARGTLWTLARRQGTRHDPETEEAPGKILHEVRRGSLTHRGDLPPNYYGSVDATPLFVILLSEAWRWGLPDDQVRALLPHAEAALAWMTSDGDPDGDGFLEYLRPDGRGLANQGWKDSHDAIQYADGRLAEPPIALAEVQAYAHEAARRGAELLDRFDRPGATGWHEWADRLGQRFREAFWVTDADGAFPAMALDADNRPVDALASNMGHLLIGDLLDADETRRVADRLASPPLSSGWGLRTLATTAAGFNPLGYHAGSVWPHDTAIAASGLARHGHPEAARRLINGLLRAAPFFDYRLPELLGGVAWEPGGRPVPYPVACRPQAWAAASSLLLVRACLGVDAHLPDGRLRLRPLWPPPIAHIELRDLPLGTGHVDIVLDEDTGVDVRTRDIDLAIEISSTRSA